MYFFIFIIAFFFLSNSSFSFSVFFSFSFAYLLLPFLRTLVLITLIPSFLFLSLNLGGYIFSSHLILHYSISFVSWCCYFIVPSSIFSNIFFPSHLSLPFLLFISFYGFHSPFQILSRYLFISFSSFRSILLFYFKQLLHSRIALLSSVSPFPIFRGPVIYPVPLDLLLHILIIFCFPFSKQQQEAKQNRKHKMID